MFESVPPYAGRTVRRARPLVRPKRQPCRIAHPRPFLLPPLTVIIFYRTWKPILNRTPKPILNLRRGGLDAPYAQRH